MRRRSAYSPVAAMASLAQAATLLLVVGGLALLAEAPAVCAADVAVEKSAASATAATAPAESQSRAENQAPAAYQTSAAKAPATQAPPAQAHAAQAPAKQAGAGPAPCAAAFRVREQDSIWLVSTRHLGCSVGWKDPPLGVFRFEGGWWQPRNDADFAAAGGAERVTAVYVHGNQISADLAGSYGLSVYFELAGKWDDEPAVRFVIWSWPSDEIRGPLRDVRAKAARSDVDAYYLGTFLARMQPSDRVGLVGYSFGARIVSGGLHLVGGGRLFGYAVQPASGTRYRAALWAAAEHNHWYMPGQFHDHALATAEAWFIAINGCDPILARYRFLDKCGDPAAVGYCGIDGRNLLPAEVNARIEEMQVSHLVGGDHNWRPYLYSPYIQNRTREVVLWHTAAATAAPAAAAAPAPRAPNEGATSGAAPQEPVMAATAVSAAPLASAAAR